MAESDHNLWLIQHISYCLFIVQIIINMLVVHLPLKDVVHNNFMAKMDSWYFNKISDM